MYQLIILFLIVIYLYGVRTFDYWKSRGIKHDRALPYFGTNLKNFLQRASIGMLSTEIYNKYSKEKVVGFYRGTSPELIVRDPEIIKRILITDFHCFYARGLGLHKAVLEPICRNPSFADGDLWCLARQCFSPSLSPTKLKAAFTMITKKTEKLQTVAEKVSLKDSHDMLDFMGRYFTELSGILAFGIDVDCLLDDSSILRKLSKKLFQMQSKNAIVHILKILFPEACKNFKIFSSEISSTIIEIVEIVLKEKNNKPTGSGDFLDFLLNMKQEKGKVTAESIESQSHGGSAKHIEMEIDDSLIAAQTFNYFGASYETATTSTAHALHQLAYHPQCQKKVQIEVDEVLARHDNKFTYEAVTEMKYLHMVLCEAMRLYPPVGHIVRVCTSTKYKISEINLTITEGVRILIPIQALQRDEKYFKNATQFDPLRFHPDQKENLSFVYMPFGVGPRACIGERLGQLISVAGLAAILQKFTVEPATNSVQNPPPNPAEYILESFIGGLPLKLRKRKKTVSMTENSKTS